MHAAAIRSEAARLSIFSVLKLEAGPTFSAVMGMGGHTWHASEVTKPGSVVLVRSLQQAGCHARSNETK